MLYRCSVEPAAKRRIRRIRNYRNLPHRALGTKNFKFIVNATVTVFRRQRGKWLERVESIGLLVQSPPVCDKIRQHAVEHLLIRQHVSDGRLRLVEFGGSNHLHCRCNLQCTVDGRNAILYFFQ